MGMSELDKSTLIEAVEILEDAAAAILQLNGNLKGSIIDAVLAKGVGVAGTSGITGLIGALGSASTGTAIGSLSGAAATTAKLYWIGSLVGGGVATGGFLLGAAAVVGGFAAARYWRGKKRSERDLDEYEIRILKCIEITVPALRHDIKEPINLDPEYEKSFLPIWGGLMAEIDLYLKQDAKDRLAWKHFLKLKKVYARMKRLNKKFLDVTNDPSS